MTITLEQFLDLLPTAPMLPIALVAADLGRHGIEEPEPFPTFIPPTLRRVSKDGALPSILLVSAPGAVGKTTLAREIARRIGSPLWHLGQVNVGHEFLTGAIARAFGDAQYSLVKGELISGRRCLVLDGLDEARLRAGQRNFEAFLERLADDFRSRLSAPALVLLGRAEAVNETKEWLEVLEIPSARYEIEYFDKASAVRFVDSYLDAKSHAKPHRQAAVQFGRARDIVLDRLELAVPEGVDARSLAGYAPVLQLVSTLLDVRNPYAEFQAIQHEVEKWRLDTLVGEIAQRLLDREHDKTVEQLQKELASRTPSAFQWESAYQRDEQCLRFLSNEARYSLPDPPPATLPRELREAYESRLREWIDDHPFTAQPLFLDYAYAWLYTSDSGNRGLADAVRARLTESANRPYRPTPLLARFAADVAAAGGGQPQFRMRADDFGFIYESAVSGLRSDQRQRLTLASSTDGEEIIGEFATGIVDMAGGERLPIRLLHASSGLWFWRRLSHADIDVTNEVRIGMVHDEFVLGPAVTIEAGTFACESRNVRILAPREELSVILTAETYRGGMVELLGPSTERSHLRISWMPRTHPWAPYAFDIEPEIPVSKEMVHAFRRLRRLLVWFRAEGYGDLARHQDLLDNPAVAGSGAGRAILEYSLKQGLVRAERPMYVLDRGALDKLGINWSDIQQRRITQPIARFLDPFLRDSG